MYEEDLEPYLRFCEKRYNLLYLPNFQWVNSTDKVSYNIFGRAYVYYIYTDKDEKYICDRIQIK